jgi:predicted transcriptional regulator
MAGTEAPTVVLLPIKPEYARPIMDGRKRVEFRKTVFSQTPTHVVVYASSPMKKVLGYFEVDEVDVDAVDALWARYAAVGGIAEDVFRAYYAGRQSGVALGVERVVALTVPMPLQALGVANGPPQSFMYLHHSVLETVDESL